MEIQHSSITAARSFLTRYYRLWDTIVISNNRDVVGLEIRTQSKNYLNIVFDDIDCPLPGYIHPREDHVESVLKFAVGKENILVVCQNGRTRSAAVAYVLRCREYDPETALGIIHLNDYPNILFVEHASVIMQMPSMLSAMQRWVLKHQQWSFPAHVT